MEGETTHMHIRKIMVGASCYGDDGATDLGGLEGIVESRCSHGVKDDVITCASRMLGDIFLDRSFLVVNSCVGTKFLAECDLFLTRCSDMHLGSSSLGELKRNMAYATGCGMNKHSLFF